MMVLILKRFIDFDVKLHRAKKPHLAPHLGKEEGTNIIIKLSNSL